MRKLSLLLSILVLVISGCASKPATNSLPADAHHQVQVSLTFNHRSGIAANQFAVWIENSDGAYIKTLFVTRFTASGGWKTRPEAIPGWVLKSGLSAGSAGNIDAATGATPKSGDYTYVWDCSDANGEPVPDGEYRFIAEGTIFWQDAVTYSGVIKIGDEENSAQAAAQYTTEDAKKSDMITNVGAVYKP